MTTYTSSVYPLWRSLYPFNLSADEETRKLKIPRLSPILIVQRHVSEPRAKASERYRRKSNKFVHFSERLIVHRKNEVSTIRASDRELEKLKRR